MDFDDNDSEDTATIEPETMADLVYGSGDESKGAE